MLGSQTTLARTMVGVAVAALNLGAMRAVFASQGDMATSLLQAVAPMVLVTQLAVYLALNGESQNRPFWWGFVGYGALSIVGTLVLFPLVRALMISLNGLSVLLTGRRSVLGKLIVLALQALMAVAGGVTVARDSRRAMWTSVPAEDACRMLYGPEETRGRSAATVEGGLEEDGVGAEKTLPTRELT